MAGATGREGAVLARGSQLGDPGTVTLSRFLAPVEERTAEGWIFNFLFLLLLQKLLFPRNYRRLHGWTCTPRVLLLHLEPLS